MAEGVATFAARPASQAGGRGHPRHKREAERSPLCLPCKGLRGGVGAGSARRAGTRKLPLEDRSSVSVELVLWSTEGASEPREGLEGSSSPFRVSGRLTLARRLLSPGRSPRLQKRSRSLRMRGDAPPPVPSSADASRATQGS